MKKIAPMKVGLGINPNKMQNRRESRSYKTSDIGERLTEGKLFIKRVWRNRQTHGTSDLPQPSKRRYDEQYSKVEKVF